MKENVRKETKIGALLFVVFNVVRIIADDKLTDLPLIHFSLGLLSGAAILLIMIGFLPEDKYLRIKSFKRNFGLFIK